MTKAKARERAKAKASQKVKKREAGAGQPEQKKIKPGQFDPGPGSITSPGVSGSKNFSGARRGGARSR